MPRPELARSSTARRSAPLLLSGLFGIFVGDSLLFTTLNRLGPRRAGVLFALNAPIAALLAWLALGETLAPRTLAGIALTVGGRGAGDRLRQAAGAAASAWEAVRGPLWLGIAAGLGAATGQALGSLIARPVMAARARSLRRLAGAGRGGRGAA